MLEINKIYKTDRFDLAMRYVGFGNDGRRYFELLYRKTINGWVINADNGIEWYSRLFGNIQDTPTLTGRYWGFKQDEIDEIVFEEFTSIVHINSNKQIIPTKLKTKFIME